MRPPTSEQLQQQQQQQQQVAKESEEKYSSTSAYLADESKLTNHHLPSADQRTAPCIPQSPEASSSGVGHSPVHGASCVGLKCKSLPQPPECFQLEIGLKRPAASRDMAAGHQLQSSVAGVQHSHTPRCCQFVRLFSASVATRATLAAASIATADCGHVTPLAANEGHVEGAFWPRTRLATCP